MQRSNKTKKKKSQTHQKQKTQNRATREKKEILKIEPQGKIIGIPQPFIK
jgi:hypothetical protein